MAGYDLVSGPRAGYLSKEKLTEIVSLLEEVAGGKTLNELEREGKVNRRSFYRTLVEFPDVAKAFAVAREMSGYSLEDKALDAATDLILPNDYNGTRVKAVQVAMEQWRWSAVRRNKKEFGDTSAANLVVPIQINTTLDIGQPGAKVAVMQDNVYEFAAKFEKDDGAVVDANSEPVYTPQEEPVEGAAKFGITDVPRSILPKKPAGRPVGKGKHKTAAGTAGSIAAYARKAKGKANGGTDN